VGTVDAAYAWSDEHPSPETSYAVFPLSGRLKQINDLIHAIEWVDGLLALVFLVVVVIGVFNTYQMIAFERIREVGTMRALGMQKSGVVLLYLAESLILGLISSVVGLVLGTATSWTLGQIDLSGNQMAQMFLEKGRVVWAWPWQNVLTVLGIMALTTVLGAVWPAWRVSRLKTVDALRHE
jgi:putative ABC transport system permease protein